MRPVLIMTALTVLVADSSVSAQNHPGEILRTIACPSPCPTGIAAKADRLWIVDRFTDKIYELDLESGKVLRELEAPCYQPMGLTIDAEGKLWVGSDLPDYTHDKLYRVDPDSTEVIAILPSPVDFVRSLAWEQKSLWVGTRKTQLARVDPDDGSVLGYSPVPSTQISGLGFDGRYLWSADRGTDQIHVVEPRTGEVVFVLPAPGPSVSGVACAGGCVYVLDYEKRAIYELRT